MAGPQMQLEDWLDDLCVRFIINLPQEDLSSVERICFQVEEAQWFYEDFIRPLDPSLPSMTLRTFCLRIFQHCPLLASFSVENHLAAFEVFLQYKTRIPVRGAILLNHDMDSVVLVKGWKKGANWSFPRGKINKDEDDLDCAVREVYEETGMDLRAHGLVPTTGKPKYIEIAMREQQLRLYVFRDVPMDYNFQPQTRKEISKIQWYKLSELPTFRKKNVQNPNEPVVGANKFYMVAPFLVPLKKWVTAQKRQEEKRVASLQYHAPHAQLSVDEGHTEDEIYVTDHGANYLQQPTSIASLDGATKELQRLLKMQPPTQGLQPAMTQEDKGSALLSILQSNDSSVPSTSLQHGVAIPHAPQDVAIANPPQPQDLHYNNDQQPQPMSLHMSLPQQLPPFSLPHAADNVTQQKFQEQQQYPIHPALHGHPGVPHHQSQKSIPLVHPQPLPPQVQRAMFNNSVFQEAVAKGNAGVSPSPYSQWQQPSVSQANAPPQQQQRVPPMQLTGQSMALLNAFKRAPSGSQQPPMQQQEQQHLQGVKTLNTVGPAGQNLPPPPPYSQYPAQQHRRAPQGAVPNQAMPYQDQFSSSMQPQQPPVDMTNPPHIATDQHRNTLLGIFKKAGPSSPVQQPPSPLGFIPELSSPSQRKPSSGTPPVELGISNLSIQPPLNSGHGQHPPQPSPPQHRSNSRTAAPYGGIPSPYGLHAPLNHQPQQPSPLAQHSAPAGTDQKQQLLSLFGAGAGAGRVVGGQPAAPQLQARSPLGSNIHEMGNGNPTPREVSGSRIASLSSTVVPGEPGSGTVSRRGSQTPISPADESFLLGYLQSVTKTASR
ncbi:decapping enzyme Dcp2 [Cordyceps javanica]|uniref:Decapping enzyme Dcp2 n=1 Tax=Cordyceps javanica TaxID=43265 RepID=A0A545WBC4_9HYPO|nr:decapping enzyme Dcp2 [Cordyceps javanica]TQW11290.1 decapping enzyme Dcp2 [Cordyceps javanica]